MIPPMPHDPEIEKDVLGCLVKFPDRMHDSGVTIRHFFHEPHRRCFAALQGKGCSPSVIMGAVGEDVELVEDICERSWSDASLPQHLAHLQSLAEIREASSAAAALISDLEAIDPPDARARIEKATSALARATVAGDSAFVDGCNADEELASESGERFETCFEGFYLRRSEVTFLAAEPKTGKTTFATQIARGFVERYDGLTLMFSMEMSAKEIFEKDIQRHNGSRIWQKFEDGRLNPRYSECATQVRDWYRNNRPGKFLVDPRGSATIQQIRSRVLQAQAQTSRRIRTIIIDQFDKLVPERHSQNDAVNSKSISVALNCLAKELDAAVFCLIQVNARNKKNPSERYTKNDIFGTSGPEQDAGQIWLMQRVPETSWNERGELPIEVSFEVGRAGVGGSHPMTHIGPSSTIVKGHSPGSVREI